VLLGENPFNVYLTKYTGMNKLLNRIEPPAVIGVIESNESKEVDRLGWVIL